jgi:hypothetical protein
VRRNRLVTFYDRFDPEERFRLTVEALARGDEKEVEQLSNSCSRSTYTMNDPAYVNRVRAGLQMAMTIFLDLTPRLAELRMLETVRSMQPHARTFLQNEVYFAYFDGHRSGSQHAWRLAGMKNEPPGWDTDEEKSEKNADPATERDLKKIETRLQETAATFVPELLEILERKFVVEIRTVWQAFTGFCEEELGFAPETLLKAYFEPMLSQAEELNALSNKPDMPDPNPDCLKEVREAMSDTWTALTRSNV